MPITVTDDPEVRVTKKELARYRDEYQRAYSMFVGDVPTLAQFIHRKQTQKPLRDRIKVFNG